MSWFVNFRCKLLLVYNWEIVFMCYDVRSILTVFSFIEIVPFYTVFKNIYLSLAHTANDGHIRNVQKNKEEKALLMFQLVSKRLYTQY